MILESHSLETHPFVGDSNQFECLDCGRPRALHLQDGFKPGPDFHHMSMYPQDRPNRHPRFSPETMTVRHPPVHPPTLAEVQQEIAREERNRRGRS